jgi:hypothetical protein
MDQDKEKGPIPEVSKRTRPPSVFLSHDSRDAQLANAFGEMMRACSCGFAKAWQASDREGSSGIPFGDNWFPWIMAKLRECTDLVALLTPNSFERPWILFEAGVAAGLGKPVLGLLVKVRRSALDKTPFRAWQNSECTEVDLVKLVKEIFIRGGANEPPASVIQEHVAPFLKQVNEAVFKGAAVGKEAPDAQLDLADLFERRVAEIKTLVGARPEFTVMPDVEFGKYDWDFVGPMRQEFNAAWRSAVSGDKFTEWGSFFRVLRRHLPQEALSLDWLAAERTFHRTKNKEDPSVADRMKLRESVREALRTTDIEAVPFWLADSLHSFALALDDLSRSPHKA